jgi:transcriptional regulator
MELALTQGNSMYVPKAFSNEDKSALHEFLREHALGTLVTTVNGRLQATHVPCVLDAERGENGYLRFHLTATNPSAQILDSAGEVLFVFTGPEHYISPDWYDDPKLVPTWNYTAVHIYGTVTRLSDAGLCELLEDLSNEHEGRLPKQPWTTDKLPQALYAKLRAAIVGFELPISIIEGKWKLNQNRTAADRKGAAQNLRALNEPQALAVAVEMEQTN